MVNPIRVKFLIKAFNFIYNLLINNEKRPEVVEVACRFVCFNNLISGNPAPGGFFPEIGKEIFKG